MGNKDIIWTWVSSCQCAGVSVGLVIAPTLVIEHQMENTLKYWGTRFLNLSKITTDTIADQIKKESPHTLICNVERLKDPNVQSALLSLKLSYVAIDETQVHFDCVHDL